MTRVAVIGSNSFSGSHFAAFCVRQGCEVLGVSRSPEPHPVFLPYTWTSGPGTFRFLQLDLNQALPAVLEALRDFRPRWVVNFAAQGMVAQSWLAPLDWYRTNLLGLVGLVEGLRGLDGLERFVQASTPEVYGSTSGLVSEEAPFNPTTPYAISKAAFDMHLLAVARTLGFPAALTRSANVAGPGQQLYRILPRAILAGLTGEPMTLDGGGPSVRSFIHIEDVCRATFQICQRSEPASIHHLSTRHWVSIRELVERVCQRLGVAFEDCVRLGPGRTGQDFAYRLDPTRAERELGWSAEVSLERLIDETVDWVRAHLEVLRTQPKAYLHRV